MYKRLTKRILLGLSFLLLTWSIIGVVLTSPGLGEAEAVAFDLSPSVNFNSEAKDLDVYSYMISSATSVVNVISNLLISSWNSGGSNIAWSDAAYIVLEASFMTLALGTVSIERRDNRRIQKLRDRVVFEVGANPGVHLRELHRIIGCAMGALQYHLKFLEQEGQVMSLRIGNVRHIFSPLYSSDENVMRLTAISRNPTVGSILLECAKNGQTTQAEISRTIDVEKSLISYYVKGLLKADILRSVRVFGREKPVLLTDWARTAIDIQGILVH